MRRAIVIVMDGCGVGAAPDAAKFDGVDGSAGFNPHSDRGIHSASTLLHVWEAVGGFNTPTLERLGLLHAAGIPSEVKPEARWGRLEPLSQGGKDSVTGHWEMMGIVIEKPFPTYPDGFPSELIALFEQRAGLKVIGNRAASGTQIIAELGAEHVRTGSPILYTSADSVFQIAAHESVIPIERLYELCEIAREVCVEPYNVQRVIARPFEGDEASGFRRTERRKDYPLAPPPNLCDEIGDVYGIGVIPELFNGRGFRSVPRTQSNPQHARALDEALQSDARFIWANFEDFDMLYGHRNDPSGFARCLEEFDQILAKFVRKLSGEDLLILTADHGNDPTSTSTDHSREYVPFLSFVIGGQTKPLGDLRGFAHVGEAVRHWLR